MTKPNWLKPPAELPESARKHWNYYASELRRQGYLTQSNRQTFLALCVFLGLADDAAAEIGRTGVVIRTETGATKSNPAIATLVSARREAMKLLGEFGFE